MIDTTLDPKGVRGVIFALEAKAGVAIGPTVYGILDLALSRAGRRAGVKELAAECLRYRIGTSRTRINIELRERGFPPLGKIARLAQLLPAQEAVTLHGYTLDQAAKLVGFRGLNRQFTLSKACVYAFGVRPTHWKPINPYHWAEELAGHWFDIHGRA